MRFYFKIQMKLYIITTITFIFILNSCTPNFESLSIKEANTETLLKNIEPNDKVTYWQLERVLSDSKVLFSKGEKPAEIIISNAKYDFNGFFVGCEPMFCAYRITYFENGRWGTVRTEQELKKFIDTVENVSEAFLIGKINDYMIDIKSDFGNGFIELKNGFKLNMMKYEICPESKESFTFFVTKNGTIENLKNNGFYMKSKDCIVY